MLQSSIVLLAVLVLLMFLTVDVSGILGVAIIIAIAAVHTAVDASSVVLVFPTFLASLMLPMY
jgi:hypothetical protein